MNVDVQDGEIRISIESLIRDAPDVERAVAKEVIFNELLLTAIVSLALTGECDWEDGTLPWYIISVRSVNFERLRQRIVEVAPEAAKKLSEELLKQRDRMAKDLDVYQTRAWQAENFVRMHRGWIEDMLKSRFGRRAEELDDLARICARPSHVSAEDSLLAAAEAVVERWDTPLWKDAPATAGYINALRAAVAARLERGAK